MGGKWAARGGVASYRRQCLALAACVVVAKLISFSWLLTRQESPAPDELRYAQLSAHLAEAALTQSDIDSLLQRRPFIYAAALLVRLDLAPLTSVRAVSGLLSVVAAILLFRLLLARLEVDAIANPRVAWFLSLAIACVPSHLLWGTVGLRDSGLEVAVLIAVSNLSRNLNWRRQACLCLGVALVASLQFLSGLVVTLALVAAMLRSEFKPAVTMASVAVILTGGLLGGASTMVSWESATSSVQESSSDSLAQYQACTVLETTSGLDEFVVLPSEQRCRGRIDANSAIPVDACWRNSSATGTLSCEVLRLPSATARVLVLPLPGLGSLSHGRLMAQLAAAENVLWLIVLAVLVIGGLCCRRSRNQHVQAARYFALTYALALGLLEGNLGTAFRHKSLLLWTFAVLGSCAFQHCFARYTSEKSSLSGDI